MSEQLATTTPKPTLTQIMADRYNLEPTKFLSTIVNTVFPAPKPNDPPVTNEQVAAFLVVAKEYDLNPFIKEIYAFPGKGGGIVPIVSIDGWITLINRQPMLDGIEFRDTVNRDGKITAIETTIYRRDRSHPTKVTEYLSECSRNTDPWNKMPGRMLRHKSLIQCSRIAFGLSGIYDQDEAEVIYNVDNNQSMIPEGSKTSRLAEQIKATTATSEVQPAHTAIDVCAVCGTTEQLTEAFGKMYCPNDKPKPTPVAEPVVVQPATQAPGAVVETKVAAPVESKPAPVTTPPATPPWARPKTETPAQPAPTQVATAPPAGLSLEAEVAKMAEATPAKPRIKSKNPVIKGGVQVPEFVDRVSDADAWTTEQYTRALNIIKQIPGADPDTEGLLQSTVEGWIGLSVDKINAATMEAVIQALGNFIKPA